MLWQSKQALIRTIFGLLAMGTVLPGQVRINSLSDRAIKTFTLPGSPALTITNTSPLPAATIGIAYSDAFTASGGSGGYTWTASGLPSWLTLTTGGVLSGTPPTGTTSITLPVTVTDSSSNTASETFTLPVVMPLMITTTSPLPAGTIGAPYTDTFTASGGGGAYTWSAIGLPEWLTFSTAGVLTGTPPAGTTSVTFGVTVSDSSTRTKSRMFVLPVNSVLTINTTSPLPAATTGTLYTDTFTASGGSGGYVWSASGLPSWLTLTAGGVLSGTPPATATSVTFSVTVADSSNHTATQNFTLPVNAALTINNTSPLPAATIGAAYTDTFTASGGTGGYVWSATSLPSWLTLTTAGVLSGTPPVGTTAVTFPVTVTDSSSDIVTRTFNLPVNAGLTIITTSPLPAATIGAAYTDTYTASGGSGGYIWSATATGLPSWLTITSGGVLSGTPPTGTTAATLLIKVTDSSSNTASKSFTLPVNAALTIITTSPLPTAAIGTVYTDTFAASGGSGGYTWTATGLPSWLTLTPAGVLSGTPPAGATAVTFPVTVTDSSSHTATQTFTLPFSAVLTITTTSPLPAGTIGVLYSNTFAASGGSGGYTWTATGLPSWLTFSTAGVLSGTPPTGTTSVTFVVKVTDSSSAIATKNFTLPVNSVLTINNTSPLPAATVGVLYSYAFAASGGVGALNWTGTDLPAGLSLSTGGVLSGTPTTSGTFNVGIKVADVQNQTASKNFSIVIANSPPLQFVNFTLPSCNVGSPCIASINATGGVPPYAFSLNQTQSIGDDLLLSAQGLITGTPVVTGKLSFSVRVTDSDNHTISNLFSIQVNASGTGITTASLPAGTVGVAYSATLQATGAGPDNWTIASGTLPPGLSLASTGVISGTPLSAGSSTFVVQVSSSTLNGVTATFTIAISSLPPLTITSPLQLPVAQTGTAYSQILTATSGTGPYTWAITAGALPTGLHLSSTGAITGTASTAQTSTLTATVTDGSGSTASRQFSLTVIDPAVTNLITTSPLPDGIVNQPYNFSINVMGGTPPYTWSIAQGMIPDGLTFNSTNGSFSGTPTTTGSFTFALTVIDSKTTNPSTATKIYTVHVVAATDFHIMAFSSPPNGTVNAPYTDTLTAIGGTTPYQWQLVNGTLPPGLSLDSAGTISGTPTAAGTYTVIVETVDSAGLVATVAFNLTVGNANTPSIINNPPPGNGTLGMPYSQVLAASGGMMPYTWSVVGGSLPLGLTLNSTTGVLSGTPAQKGAFQVTIQVSDAAGVNTSQTFTIKILANDLQISTGSVLPNASANVPYTFALTVTGGTAPYRWSLSAGSLVSGFSIDPATGILSGTPTQIGTLHFNVSVTDQNFGQASQAFDLTVVGTMLIVTTTQTTQTATVGADFSFTLTAAQGDAPYTWSVFEGSLAPGITLNSQTGALTGRPTMPGTFIFTIQVSDLTGGIGRAKITLIVKAVVFAITTGSPLPAGTAGMPYSQTFQTGGGTGAITWAISSGTPSGLALASATGVLSGTPTMAGDFSFTLTATNSTGTSASQTYSLHIAGLGTITASASGLPATVNPGDQPVVNVTLAGASTLPVTLTATLTITPNLSDNTDLLFSNGSRTIQFTIPANTTQFSFPFQAGTLAGTIQVAITFQAAGVDVTPSPAPVLSTTIVAAAPAIKSIVVTQTTGGLQVVIDGVSTPRDMKTATFQFTAAPGATLQTTSVTVDLSAMFVAWYQNPDSLALGSQFSLTVPFTIGGNVHTISSVSVTLTNSVGTSATASANVP